MQDRWRLLLEKFAALSNRERALVVIALFAIAYQFADLVILDRQYQEIQMLNGEMARDRQEIARLNTDLNMLTSRAQLDPDQALRTEIERLRKTNQTLHSDLQHATGELISPQDMSRFLEQLLLQESELTLLRLRTLDPEPLLKNEAGADGKSAQKSLLHRHGFAVEFSGSYLATLRYLRALESLPWQFFWDSVDYEVMDYPDSVVRMELHTLSLSEDWIGV